MALTRCCCRNLKQCIAKFKELSIAHDLHLKERGKIKCLVEAKQEQVVNCGEDAWNYRFQVVGQVISESQKDIIDKRQLLRHRRPS